MLTPDREVFWENQTARENLKPSVCIRESEFAGVGQYEQV